MVIKDGMNQQQQFKHKNICIYIYFQLCGISLIHKHHGEIKDGHHLYFLHDFFIFIFLFIYGLKIEFMYRLAKKKHITHIINTVLMLVLVLCLCVLKNNCKMLFNFRLFE